MKAKVTYSLYTYTEIIDLCDYGLNEDDTVEDLTEHALNEIKDMVLGEKFILIDIETINK